ncbi:MAG TPA: phosphatase PAP2 family protein [Gemmatimonadales bacterium]|nr:phosphatase PAP2 family protein [Gemmatimonadales bacterium]
MPGFDGPPSDHGRRALMRAPWDLAPLVILACFSTLAVVLLDLLGIEPGLSSPLRDAPATWVLVLAFPLIVALLDATVRRLRRRLPWAEALRRVPARRILELAVVVAALRLLLLSAVARKEAIPHLRGGFLWDGRLAAADRWLHGGVTPDHYLRWLLDSPGLLRAVDLFYLEGFWIGCVSVLLWWGWRQDPERGRFFTAFALVWLVLGALVATVFSSAGPCYYQLVTGDPLYARLMETLHRQPLAATGIQELLWRNYLGQATGVAEGISAFPSIHVAMPALFAWSARGAWRWPAWSFCLLVLLGSVALGWYYALDGYAAIPGAWLCWWAAGAVAPGHPPAEAQTDSPL